MNIRQTFDFEIDIHGARIIATRSPLSSAALSDGEVDAQITILKRELDTLGNKMKKAIQEQKNRPLF